MVLKSTHCLSACVLTLSQPSTPTHCLSVSAPIMRFVLVKGARGALSKVLQYQDNSVNLIDPFVVETSTI